MIGRQRFGLGDVEPRGFQLPGTECREQCFLIDCGAATDVVEDRAAPHFGQTFTIDKMP